MPWNPQRVVQRNGRVIRLLSPRDEVHLLTMLPSPGDLERLLGLEARVRMKIKAASGVYGMESAVVEGMEPDELRAFAGRLADGDASLLDEAEQESGAVVGEELRSPLARAAAEGELVDEDLDMLRRIDPGAVEAPAGDLDLEWAWRIAAADIVAAHNARTDLRAQEEPIGPRQSWALSILRDPAVVLPEGAEAADEALSVARGPGVRRALGEIEAAMTGSGIGREEAARRIVAAGAEFGLRPVPRPPLPRRITEDELGVVCWMGVLPPAA